MKYDTKYYKIKDLTMKAFAHCKPDISTLWFDYLDFHIRFMLNNYPIIYIN